MSAETWGIVMRDRASGAEQWIACEVSSIGDGAWRANPKGMISSSEANSASGAVKALALFVERADPTLAFVRIETPAEYAAHMESVCLTLAIDEANDLRAEVTRLADTLGAIGRNVGAESCDRDVILNAIRERGEDAFRRGAEAMREVCADLCDIRSVEQGSNALQYAANVIRALPLPVEATPRPAQSHEAPATPDAPLTVADAAARARSAAARRVASEGAPIASPDAVAWVATWTDTGPRGLRVIRGVLATVAPERWQAKRIVEDAGLNRGRIDMGGAPLLMWHAIVDEAVKMERLDELVAAARTEYPRCGL